MDPNAGTDRFFEWGAPDNEWQTIEGTIVGNRITVMLNGPKVHDNTALDAITGNALDANELDQVRS